MSLGKGVGRNKIICDGWRGGGDAGTANYLRYQLSHNALEDSGSVLSAIC